MKHLFVLILFISVAFACNAQLSGIVLNSESGEPIPYVNVSVINHSSGATSEFDGRFAIPKVALGDTIIASAIGYTNLQLIVRSTVHDIKLKPKVYEITEVVISPKKQKKPIIINPIKKRLVRSKCSCSISKPWMAATFFAYKPEYASMPFIKEVAFITNSDIENAKFNLRFFGVKENGEVGEELLKDNIVLTTKKGKQLVKVDVTARAIQFPHSGIFVALEWLALDENKKEYTMLFTNGKKETMRDYEPSFGCSFNAYPKMWNYRDGKWERSMVPVPHMNGKYYDLSVELRLID